MHINIILRILLMATLVLAHHHYDHPKPYQQRVICTEYWMGGLGIIRIICSDGRWTIPLPPKK